jgi:16S rRNA G966 N2-methylase RsmD
MNNISTKDYYRMWRARGIRLPIQYFFQNHLFDIINGTDTHFRLEKKDYRERPEGFESGVLYMSSPTREVKNSLGWIERRLGQSFYDFQFFDLGCGKGKTLIIYSRMYGEKPNHRAIGIEYYKLLADIAEKNLKITNTSELCRIYHADARQFHKFRTSEKVILYVYNPFAENVLSDILESCIDLETYVIYTDPVYQDMVQSKGFKLLYEKKGGFPNTTVSVFARGGK